MGAGHLLEKCTAWVGADCTNWDYQQYVWLGDIPVAVRLQSVWVNDEGYISYTYAEMFNIHTDHLNTPRRLTRSQDATNAVQWRWDSDAFGVGFENDPYLQPYAVDLRFPGQLWDAETWRHYNMFRDYDPYVGRYVESDPIGLKGGINTYNYVSGSPLMKSDPTGLLEWTCYADGTMDDRTVKGNSVKYCTYKCRAKCEKGGAMISTSISAPGYDTGQGQVCIGAIVRTQPSMDGTQLSSYAKGYRAFSVNTSGFFGVIDSIRRPGELVDALRRAEQGKCCGQ
jgi:RHS repeat-associated protein